MIIEIFQYIVLVGLGGLFWYYVNNISAEFIDKFVARYPSVYDMNTVNFIKAFNSYLLLFLILGAGFALYITTQRKTTPEGYY